MYKTTFDVRVDFADSDSMDAFIPLLLPFMPKKGMKIRILGQPVKISEVVYVPSARGVRGGNEFIIQGRMDGASHYTIRSLIDRYPGATFSNTDHVDNPDIKRQIDELLVDLPDT